MSAHESAPSSTAVKAFVGQTRARALIARLTANSVGEMTVRGEYPPRRTPWALDNGAFGDWANGTPFDAVAFEFAVNRWSFSARHPAPEFIVVPDVVADAKATFELANAWVPKIRGALADRPAPLAFVVQDGMLEADVAPVLADVEVLFVGGTVDWKWSTAERWCALAHSLGRRCHIGRVGTPRLVRRAQQVGADSIDSAYPLWSAEHLEAFLAALQGHEPQAQLGLAGVR